MAAHSEKLYRFVVGVELQLRAYFADEPTDQQLVRLTREMITAGVEEHFALVENCRVEMRAKESVAEEN